MPAPISIVIPTLNSCRDLRGTLPCLDEGFSKGLIHQIIFSDGGSHDDIEALCHEIGAKFIAGKRGRGAQLRAGAKAAESEWLWFLHADTRPPPDWSKEIMKALSTPQNGHVAQLRFDDLSWQASFVAKWANIRTRRFHLPYGDQSLLIHRNLYDALGGFDDMPLMEDVAMARKLGKKISILPFAVTTSAESYRKNGWFRRGAKNLTLLLSYQMGVSAERLAARYYK